MYNNIRIRKDKNDFVVEVMKKIKTSFLRKNIFENAYFGKAYKTRDGRKAIIVSLSDEGANLAVDIKIKGTIFDSGTLKYYLNGKSRYHTENDDIISEWEDSINKEELYNIADLWVCDNGVENSRDGIEAFIAGYNFAKKGE